VSTTQRDCRSGSAGAVGDGVREPRLLQGQEEADVARRGVERADEGDQEQRPEALGQGEGDAGQRHQRGGAEEQAAPGEPVGVEADEEGEDRGAGQGRGRDQADLERAVPEGGEVGRQQQADQPVAEGAQGPRDEQQPGLGRGARREQARRPPPLRRRGSILRQHPRAQAVTPAAR
jgi:hypothetical protein